MTFTFTLARFNTKQGEPILVYSKPTLAAAENSKAGKRTSVMFSQKEQVDLLLKSS